MFWYYTNLKGETGLHRRGSTHSSTLWDDKRQTASEHPGISHQRHFFFHLTSEMSAKQKSFLASRWHWQGRLTRLHWASQVSDRGWPIKSWRSISNLFYKEAFFCFNIDFWIISVAGGQIHNLGRLVWKRASQREWNCAGCNSQKSHLPLLKEITFTMNKKDRICETENKLVRFFWRSTSNTQI